MQRHPGRVNSGRDKLSAELVAIGRSCLGLSVYQKMHILGWLKTAALVEPARIGLSGHNLQRYVVTALPRDGAWRHINPLWLVVPGFPGSS